MDTELPPDAGDQMNRGMFLAPSLIGDSTSSPLLDQARKNVADQARLNMERETAPDPRETKPSHKTPTHEAGGIVFASGPEAAQEPEGES